jgi:hypothetical protein
LAGGEVFNRFRRVPKPVDLNKGSETIPRLHCMAQGLKICSNAE